MRLSTITICLLVFWTCLPAIAQEPIGLGQPQPVPDPSSYNQAVAQDSAALTVNPAAQQYDYDPASYNQWDPNNPETLYPAPGPAPAPPLGPCDQRTGLGYNCPKNWYVDQKVRIMYHPTARAQTYSLYYDPYFNVLSQQVYFQNAGKAGSLSMEPSAGYDITIGKYLGRDCDNRDQFIEFTYYGLNKWDSKFYINSTQDVTLSNATVSSAATYTATSGNLFSLFGPEPGAAPNENSVYNTVSGFNRADTQTIEYDSRWDNFELNLRIKPRRRADRLLMHKNACWTREAQEGWFCSYLMGARGVTLDEYFGFFSSGTVTVTPVEGSGFVGGEFPVSGRYTSRTRNDMFGLQIGMDCIHQKGPWRFGADVKGGVFINFADNHTRAKSTGASSGDPDTGDPFSYEDVNFQHLVRSRDIASIAELGFMTSYQVRQNITFNISYDLSWVTGLALAPEQFIPAANAPARIDHNGALMMQSVSLGMEFLW